MRSSDSASRSSSQLLLGAAWLLGLVVSGCELIAHVDRSLIGDGGTGGGGFGGTGDSGATAGTGATPAIGGMPMGAGGGGGTGGGAGTSPMGAMGGAAGAAGDGNSGGDLAAGAAGGAAMAGAGGSDATSTAQGKMIYVTAMPKKANFGGVSAADALCNASVPAKAKAGASFKALLVDGTTRVACTSANCGSGGAAEGVGWVLLPNTTYVRDDGQTVIGTTTAAAIFSLPLQSSIGTQGLSYWTGLAGLGDSNDLITDWTTSSDNCSSWTATAGVSARVGLDNATDAQAFAGVLDSCESLAGNFFACVEQ